MSLPTLLSATDRYELRQATDAAEVRLAQRLRYEVFNLELNEGLPDAAGTGLDADEFDEGCDHLLVCDRETEAVVGTYRMQTGANAARHHGYYSAREFDFGPLEPARPRLVELGRACVAAGHRNQTVLGLLWRGIAHYARAHGARYLAGCSSLTSQDEAAGLALYHRLKAAHLVAPAWRTGPRPGWRCTPGGAPADPAPVPRLMRAYLAVGAKICGEPAIDREFRTIDFLTWMDLDTMPAGALRRFLA
jgi:putative hemolysin